MPNLDTSQESQCSQRPASCRLAPPSVKLRPLLISAALIALLVPAFVFASSSAKKPPDFASTALNILPPGESADSGPNSTDQLALYDGLTPLWNAVSPTNVHRLFKPETFGLQGNACLLYTSDAADE